MKYGILVSGNLGKACLSQFLWKNDVNFVMTDRGSKEIIELCNKNHIPVFAGNPRNGAAATFLKDFTTDVILSINYLFIVEKDILQHPATFAINFHGSLLPKYRGRTPHVWAIINNEPETGVTAHLMSAGCDEGDIVSQEKIKIGADATGADILNCFLDLYPRFIDKVVQLIQSNEIRVVKQDHTKATYFGRREPADGKINWNWQKEQIRNWVRAQAYPYPGAYSYYQGIKITINKIEYSDHGFHYLDENGKILLNDNDGLIVKTPNGAVKIVNIDAPQTVYFKPGDYFHG